MFYGADVNGLFDREGLILYNICYEKAWANKDTQDKDVAAGINFGAFIVSGCNFASNESCADDGT